MKCRRFKILFRAVFLLYLAAVVFLCFGKFDSLPDMQKSIFGIPTDKIVHFCMFFPFPPTGFHSFANEGKGLIHSLLTLVCICSFAAVFAGLTEVIQGSLPYRSEDLGDFGADCLAIGISGVLVFLSCVIKSRKK